MCALHNITVQVKLNREKRISSPAHVPHMPITKFFFHLYWFFTKYHIYHCWNTWPCVCTCPKWNKAPKLSAQIRTRSSWNSDQIPIQIRGLKTPRTPRRPNFNRALKKFWKYFRGIRARIGLHSGPESDCEHWYQIHSEGAFPFYLRWKS